MALKQDLKAVREELNSQEEMMKNFIKSERFIRKYKYYILIILIAILLWLGGNYTYKIFQEKSLKESNEIFNALMLDPNNLNEAQKLKEKNPNLYAVFVLSNSNDLNASLKLDLDPLLKQIILAQSGKDSEFLKDYNTLLKGYEFLKQDDFKNANAEFDKIPLNSALMQIVNSLKHYQGIK